MTTPDAEATAIAAGFAAPRPRAHHTAPAGSKENPIVIGPPGKCEECEEADRGKVGAAGLGLLLCAVAGGLLYIGVDLITNGWLSRTMSGSSPLEEADE